jgi:hypothetical protein
MPSKESGCARKHRLRKKGHPESGLQAPSFLLVTRYPKWPSIDRHGAESVRFITPRHREALLKQLTRIPFSGILFLSRSGGTGRRARLKIVWAWPMWVRFPPPAPDGMNAGRLGPSRRLRAGYAPQAPRFSYRRC